SRQPERWAPVVGVALMTVDHCHLPAPQSNQRLVVFQSRMELMQTGSQGFPFQQRVHSPTVSALDTKGQTASHRIGPVVGERSYPFRLPSTVAIPVPRALPAAVA